MTITIPIWICCIPVVIFYSLVVLVAGIMIGAPTDDEYEMIQKYKKLVGDSE